MKSEIQRIIEYEPTVKCSNEDKSVVDLTTGELFDFVKKAASECCFHLEDLTLYLKHKGNPTCLRFVQ